MEPPVTRAPAVQVASVKPPAVYGQQPSLNVEAPVFEPNVFENDFSEMETILSRGRLVYFKNGSV